ncbi:hypothetical protein SASPL_157991 [Salvia splendens]|uniref:Helicase C-terminal domain-containing protein n=1 Tax=Salvia splendens TaxID=180675 RepID=A0A8X8VTZ4_SALSN|nr:hypothetical protein SASPL_157991 [Salvia splendens]
MHVGPTNSGKTYHALKRLELSPSAHSGQEREEIDGAKHKAVTVEMSDVNSDYSCAVVDEIQDVCVSLAKQLYLLDYVGVQNKGFSFTRALLGICADELHLCGDPAAVPLIKEILKVTDDVVEVKYYDRLSPLVPLDVPLGSFSKIRTGRLMYSVSDPLYLPTDTQLQVFECLLKSPCRQEPCACKPKTNGLHIKKLPKYGPDLHHNFYRLIEDQRQHMCSVVYGSLPPATRSRQKLAELTKFLKIAGNNVQRRNNGFDVLVASDAIGMGLNLNISRIIFSTLKKFDGIEMRDLTVSEIKQIAGRAGRYKSKFPIGEVTCLKADDLPLLHSSLSSPSPTLEQGGLFPSFDLIVMFSRLHPTYGLKQILEHFVEHAKLSDNYFITNCEEMLKVAAVIDELPLTLSDKYLFVMSPVDMEDDISSQGLTQFATSYCTNHIVRLKEIFTPGTLKIPKSHKQLKELESIHKVLDLYVWLSFHMDECFPDRELAASQKAICSMLIEEFLGRSGWEKKPIPRKLSRPLA